MVFQSLSAGLGVKRGTALIIIISFFLLFSGFSVYSQQQNIDPLKNIALIKTEPDFVAMSTDKTFQYYKWEDRIGKMPDQKKD